MPRNVRNFWMTADIDGRDTRLSGGPQSKIGGMDLTLYMRDAGEVAEVVSVLCRADSAGNLVLTVQDQKGEVLFRHRTHRDVRPSDPTGAVADTAARHDLGARPSVG